MPAAAGTGPYTAADWAQARRSGTGVSAMAGNRHGSDEAYRRYLDAIAPGKLADVRALVERFDFLAHGRVLELGCGDMPQAYETCRLVPGLDYTASDFDAYVIAQCERVPMLSAIRKRVLDARGPDLEEIRHHALVVSWSLESSLEDDELSQLFSACARHRVPYLLATHTAVGPVAVALDPALRRAEAPGLRRIGWLRSAAELAGLARAAGLRLRWRSWLVNHAAFHFAPD